MGVVSRVPPGLMDYYRADGVRITHDPYDPEMVERYGKPGQTDREGFDPYADSVGPGIYGGVVERDSAGEIVIGGQYQNHNPRPGPVYAGGGYTPVNSALSDVDRLDSLLEKFPDLVNDLSTGGAQPLHMCGMSQNNQDSVATLVQHGADIEALDTYGFTPLLRMASNNLARGATRLLEAGADPLYRGGAGISPLDCALQSNAKDVARVLKFWGSERRKLEITQVDVLGSSEDSVNGQYFPTTAEEIPHGFKKVCEDQGWPPKKMWQKLNSERTWYRKENQAYIYWNTLDCSWWIDKPDGAGIFKAGAVDYAPPQTGWAPLCPGVKIPKCIRTFRKLYK